MKKLFWICFGAFLADSAVAQTNFVYVVNDDSSACTDAWDRGLSLGGWIAGGLFGIWMMKLIVSGGGREEP